MHAVRSSVSPKLRVWIFFAAMTAALVAPAARASAAATTTTLTLSSSSVASGTVVTFTAAVSNGSPVTLGTVTFCNAAATHCDNSAVIGTAQLTSAGTAVIKLVPGIGSHSYKAIFTATTSNAKSTSTAQALTVTAPAQYPTITTFSSSGSSGGYTFTSSVLGLGNLNAAPAGTVSFLDTSNGDSVVASATLGAGTLTQSFAPQVAYAAGANAYWVAAGDFNRDGYPDLAVANVTDGTVSISLGNGDGTFQPQVTYDAGGNPSQVVVGDGTALSSTQLSATANVLGAFVYSPAVGTTPAAGSDTLSVSFTPTDTTDYSTAKASVTLTVASFTLSGNGAITQTVAAGAAATFNLTVAPVGSPTLLAPVALTVSGLPTGATATFSPATVPAGSAATASKLVIQTSASSAARNIPPQRNAPPRATPICLMLFVLLLLGMQSIRKRIQLAPRLLVWALFAALSLGTVVGLSGCSNSGTGSTKSTTYNLVVTETSGTQTHTLALTLIVQ